VPTTILYADFDAKAVAQAERLLAKPNVTTVTVPHLADVDREVATGRIDVLVLDVALLGTTWLDWLGEAVVRWPDLPIVLTARSANEADSLAALRAGAAGFVGKPFEDAELRLAIENGISSAELAAIAPPSQCGQIVSSRELAGTPMVGDSLPIREVTSLVRRAAASMATVLIRGESGTGKEVIARRIHELSPRQRGPFIKVHCAALPEPLLESELFGHEKGAFTGATARKPGRLESAEGGTLFLDEIGDISLAIQVKLLRVLQDKEYERVGGTRTIRADVRFVAATHRALEEMLRRGEFREDLYYRLNVISIVSPPLRARTDDIAELTYYFCKIFGAQNGKQQLCIAPEAVDVLRAQPWPGNVRQLQNFIERLVVFAETNEIGQQLVKSELRAVGAVTEAKAPAEVDFAISVLELDEVVRRAERKALEKALRKSGGNRTIAARILGVSRRTLYNKLEEHGLVS
jgi:two-component system, NtrC family, response regulator AtoC